MLKKNNAAYTNKIEKDGYLILRKYLSKKKCDYFKKKLEAHYTKFSKKYANKKISKNQCFICIWNWLSFHHKILH